jgi:BirA family biotin operon repressor/biotin-[acetyl-CoA-carboxylase] ligase
MLNKHHHYRTLDSTNDEAKHLSKTDPLPFVVTAELQTKGRGRNGRVWVSESTGGLYYSLAVAPTVFDSDHYHRHSLEVAKRVSSVVTALSGVETDVEWPNDIIAEHRKLGGILIESLAPSSGPLPRCVVIGVGLNLNQPEFPSELEFVAVSLYQITGREYDKAHYTQALTEALIDVFERD